MIVNIFLGVEGGGEYRAVPVNGHFTIKIIFTLKPWFLANSKSILVWVANSELVQKQGGWINKWINYVFCYFCQGGQNIFS